MRPLMKKEELVIEVSHIGYGKSVLLNSHKAPMVVALIAVWSGYSMRTAELFSSLAGEMTIAIMNMLAYGEPVFAQKYRQKLSNMLA
jgi:thioredoxin-like negative regulator of GroEL